MSLANKDHLNISVSGYDLMANPRLNKGTAFTIEERQTFDLLGLLPPRVSTLDEQCQRSYATLQSKNSALEKYIYLRDLQDSNETLFYKLLLDHLEEIMPIVYTPTVGLACQRYSHIYRRPRGVYLSYPNRDKIDSILQSANFDETAVIVVTDGERILGLGDQGAGGMGIPIGKLSLYTVCGGINPASTLPILLDVGTNNAELLRDPLYVGWQHERISGEEYDNFIELFVSGIKKRFPHVLLQWEDFAQKNANPLLQKYRDQLCTFNDDIQGTAAISAGTLLAAIRACNSTFQEQKIVVVGGGSAGCGISNLLLRFMKDEGLTEQQALDKFYLIDCNGLLVEGSKNIQAFQQKFLQPKNKISHWRLEKPGVVTLFDVVKNIHPTILIGVCGQPNVFTEKVIREMAAHVARPIIFPLSNPTIKCEANPADILRWTHENAIVGTGSPFPPAVKNKRPFKIDQVNNGYIFPGIGLGIIAVRSSRVTENMFVSAARALAECSPAKLDPAANLLPPIKDIRELSFKIAVSVAKEAVRAGLTLVTYSDEEIEAAVRAKVWEPCYLPYKKVSVIPAKAGIQEK